MICPYCGYDIEIRPVLRKVIGGGVIKRYLPVHYAGGVPISNGCQAAKLPPTQTRREMEALLGVIAALQSDPRQPDDVPF